MTIQFYKKQVYGKELNYFAEKEFARCYELLTGEKTLTDGKKLLLISMFNIRFQEVLPPEK